METTILGRTGLKVSAACLGCGGRSKQADDGAGIEDVCRKAGISQQTYYRWRRKYGGLMPSEVRRLKQLEDENSRLKRMVADLSLDKAMLQDVLSKEL
jgi:putative transposase